MNDNNQLNTFVTNLFGDSYLPEVNGKLCQDIAYSTYFDIEILNHLSKAYNFYIFIGSDSGMLYKHLKQLNLDPDSIYLIVDEHKIIAQLSGEVVINVSGEVVINAPQNLILCDIESWLDKAKQTELIKYIEIDQVELINCLSAQKKIYLPYQEICAQIQQQINSLKWQHPDKFQKKIYIQRQIQNAADNIRPALALKNIFNGEPVLILGGGPSLDNYIEWVEEHQHKYVVIAASRIARRLLKTKIVPDIFVIADPFEFAFDVSKEVLAFADKSVLVSQSYAHPRIIGQWTGLHFYLGDLLPWDSDYAPENITGIGPTVVNCAMHLAIQMRLGAQILFGVDLCYSKEGYSHVSETLEHNQGRNLGFSGAKVLTNSNRQADTTYEWSEARNTIEVLAELIRQQGGTVINPYSDAAQVKHVDYIPIDDITIPAHSVNAYHYLREKTSIYAKNHYLQHYSKIIQQSNDLIGKIKPVLEHSKSIVDKIEQLEDENRGFRQVALPETIQKHLNSLKQHSTIISMVEFTGINGYLDFLHPNQFHSFSLSHYLRYYTSLYIASNIYTEELKDSIQRTQSRISEQSDSTFNPELAEQWGEKYDQHYARLLLVEKINPYLFQSIPDDVKTNLLTCYKQQMTAPIISTTIKSKDKFIQLDDCEAKLYDFFVKQDKEQLKYYIEQLQELNDEAPQALTHLAQGYLFELEQQTDLAINEYLQAEHSQTLESGLKRVLDITLKNNDLDNVIGVLHALSNISPDYLLQLADIYTITEQYKDALDSYSLYIDQNPEDILVLIKMGLLYHKLEVKEGSDFVFNQILLLNPDEKTANTLLHKQPDISDDKHSAIRIIPINQYHNLQQYNYLRSAQKLNLIKQEGRTAIGLIATALNAPIPGLIAHLTEILKHTNNPLNIYYFEKEFISPFSVLSKEHPNVVQYIQASTIQDMLTQCKVVIIPLSVEDSSPLSMADDYLYQAITPHKSHTYIYHYIDSLADEAIEHVIHRMQCTDIMYNHKCYGFSDSEMEKCQGNYVELIFNHAINQENKSLDFSYATSDSFNIKSLELALKSDYFIKLVEKIWCINRERFGLPDYYYQ